MKTSIIKTGTSIKLLSFLLNLFIYISCNNNGNSSSVEKHDMKNQTGDTHNNDSGYSQRCKLLGIEDLKKNNEHTEIRIWIEFSLSDTGKIIIFKNIDGAWIFQLHNYRFENQKGNYNILMSHNFTERNPQINWSDFLVKIKKTGLFELDDSDRAKNFGLCNDGGTIIVEILKERKHSEYIYPCWQHIENKKQINIIEKIISETESDFKIKIQPLDYVFDTATHDNKPKKAKDSGLRIEDLQ